MDPRRWEAIQAAFDQLVELDRAERASRLAAIGTTDPELRDAVEALLHADAEASERLARVEAALLGPGSSKRGATTGLLERLNNALANRYRIEKEVGHGGMATVYLAHDLRHERRVAIKVLKPELAAVVGPERFLREIKVTAQLNHPHILPLLDSGEAGGLIYYVMPYAEGESLRERLHREKQLPVEDALQIAREVADALDYAHRHDLVHRDVKPENILLEEHHAVVADFGIARAITAAGGEKLTATGVAVGTPEYMSPEQAGSSKDLDGRSDLYSLGCVLYEMLAGQPPFTGSTVESVVHQHLTAPPPAVTAMRAAVPAPVATAIAHCLAKAPADRYSTAAQLGQALRPAQMPRTAGRRWPAIAAVVAGGALVAAMGYLALGRSGSAHTGEAADVPRIVVLPFENLGRPDDEFFADGMTEEITSRLAQLQGLGVIGRTSAMQYKGGDKPIRTIGAELDVDYVLEGTVRWNRGETGRVRITPQLIRVTDETHAWADEYDAVLNDISAVQGQIAGQVVSAIGLALGPAAKVTQAAAPTRNPAAYEQFLRGNALYAQRVGVSSAQFRAVQMAAARYEEAVLLDPDFAVAWARLSLVSPPARAREAASRALALAPDLPDAHVAEGFLYERAGPVRDYPRAEAAYRRALELQPSHLEALRYLARVKTILGNTDPDLYRRLADLDPRYEAGQYNAGIAHLRLRRYDDAAKYLERYVALASWERQGYERLALLHLMRGGDTSAARQALANPVTSGFGGGFDNLRGFLEIPRFLCDHDCVAGWRDQLAHAVLGRDSAAPWHPYQTFGAMARLAGDSALARANLDSAARRAGAFIEGGHRDDLHAHQDRASVLAWLGRNEAALQEAHELVRITSFARDEIVPGALTTAAEIFALFGEDDAALELLDRLLGMPSYVSVPLVRVNPVWQRLRSNPRFEALLAKYEQSRN